MPGEPHRRPGRAASSFLPWSETPDRLLSQARRDGRNTLLLLSLGPSLEDRRRTVPQRTVITPALMEWPLGRSSGPTGKNTEMFTVLRERGVWPFRRWSPRPSAPQGCHNRAGIFVRMLGRARQILLEACKQIAESESVGARAISMPRVREREFHSPGFRECVGVRISFLPKGIVGRDDSDWFLCSGTILVVAHEYRPDD